eukprot:CAMPEP_0177610470 /NCGR_PEP_ID=MMETSP0419_2-20121207/19798_1 /TAXON_ID=582737 /ORGANISM="Tetraselmis sp., Strain GSL018" /LENGTH=398 /DNA_ID=CAMNT_0019105781 /DNA_START=210 /DNA_END=1406 /DNA_ORIENTATION=-
MWDLHKVAFGAALSPVVMLLVRGISSWISRPKPVHAPLKLKVVITGGSRGLGLALAAKFLALGDEVVISSRSGEACAEATANLEKQHPGCRVHSRACDVRNPSEVENLAKFAIASMGRCDVWVNNAGMSQNIKGRIFETDPQEIRDIVDTNLLGAIFGSRAAINRMQQQEGGGKVFLMDGRGSLGEATPLSAAYGATKRAIPQLGRTLAKECRGTGVGVHVASPGMVVTGLLLGGSGRQDRRLVRAINVLAETPDTVAEWMVPRMRGAAGTGGYFRFLTAPGVLWRFATAVAQARPAPARAGAARRQAGLIGLAAGSRGRAQAQDGPTGDPLPPADSLSPPIRRHHSAIPTRPFRLPPLLGGEPPHAWGQKGVFDGGLPWVIGATSAVSPGVVLAQLA